MCFARCACSKLFIFYVYNKNHYFYDIWKIDGREGFPVEALLYLASSHWVESIYMYMAMVVVRTCIHHTKSHNLFGGG